MNHLPRKPAHLKIRLLATLGGIAVNIILVLALALVVSTPIRAQSPPDSLPSFEVVSIKPNHSEGNSMHQVTASGFKMINLNTRFLIEFAYGQSSVPPYDALRPSQLVGGPSWIRTEQFDVDAKVDDALAEKFQKADNTSSPIPSPDALHEIQLMMQSLLKDRFKLQVHREMRKGTVLALEVAKGGPKFLNTKFDVPDYAAIYAAHQKNPDQPLPKLSPPPPCGAGMMCMWRHESMTQLAYFLWDMGDHHIVPEIERPVIDETGLKGDYYIQLQWARPAVLPGAGLLGSDAGNSPPGGAAAESTGPSIFTALEEQLGLKLQGTKGPVEYVVVDHIEHPTEN